MYHQIRSHNFSFSCFLQFGGVPWFQEGRISPFQKSEIRDYYLVFIYSYTLSLKTTTVKKKKKAFRFFRSPSDMHEWVNPKGNFTLKQNENNPCIYNCQLTEVDMRVVTLTCTSIVLHNEGNYLIRQMTMT